MFKRKGIKRHEALHLREEEEVLLSEGKLQEPSPYLHE